MSSVELFDELEAGELSIQFEGEEPEALLAWAIEEFGDRLAISTSFQADSVALIDMAYNIDSSIKVFSIDTGRLPAETLELADRLRLRYPSLDLNLISPEPGEVEGMTGKHGPDLFKTSVDLRLLCCNVRKVRPLTKHLHTLDAWVTGLRRDQWASRTNIRKVEIDHDHGAVIKLNPLAEWTEGEVWDYIRERDVPYHALYDQGYTSIGCAPCTRAVEPGAASRSGRWWWESGAPKECGIHCSVESGGLEHELHALIGDHAD
jgi:phosphoadenosine phosphosulfate reductase